MIKFNNITHKIDFKNRCEAAILLNQFDLKLGIIEPIPALGSENDENYSKPYVIIAYFGKINDILDLDLFKTAQSILEKLKNSLQINIKLGSIQLWEEPLDTGENFTIIYRAYFDYTTLLDK